MPLIIDTHIHIWDFGKAEYDWLKNDTSILHRNYALQELEPDRLEAGITGGILVQAANNKEDTGWMLQTAAATGWIKGVIGWLPLLQPETTARALDEYLSNPWFKGMRHLVHDEPDTHWLLQPPVLESLRLLADRGLPYDMVGVIPAHIETALQVAERVPGLRIVFDHLNQPPMAAKERFGRWGSLLKAAAAHPQFFVKISGLGTASGKPVLSLSNGPVLSPSNGPGGWTADDIKPYVEFVLQQFGPARCLCGGDWPVSLLAGSYTRTWSAYRQVLKELLNEEEQEQVLWKTAHRFYDL